MSESEVDALLRKLREPAEEFNTSERAALLGIVESWAHLIEVAASKSTGMPQIRRLLGLERSRREAGAPSRGEEPAADVEVPTSKANEPPEAGREGSSPSKNRDEHGRRSAAAFKKLAAAHHEHTSLFVGDGCPECERGRVYKYRPDEFTTVTGQSPLVATRHTVDTLRCNLCKAVFKAPLPEPLVEDGVGERTLYSYSAVAIVSTFRFFAGLPMHRQDKLQKALGVEVPDSSIWEMCERLADVVRPVWRELHGLAKDAPLFFGDDTGATILDTRTKVRKNRRTGAPTLRTGCHTTCIIAMTAEGQAISLFATGIHHTGEVMDLVLEGREDGLPPPVFMGDCIESNTVTQSPVLYAGCNSHAVRRFKALAENYPAEASFALERYGKIYDNERHCRAVLLGPEARRDYHQTHSRPLLREICEYGLDLQEQRRVEPNSDLGQAYNYVVQNERRLSAFARHPNAPLDNNRCEREIRICIRVRDTAHYFRNAIGAGVADTVLTVGATALAAGITLPDYFVAAQRHAADVRQRPELWVPWRYQERVAQLRNGVGGPDPPKIHAKK